MKQLLLSFTVILLLACNGNTNKTKIDKVVDTLDYSLKKKNVISLKDSLNYLDHYFNQYVVKEDSLSEILFFEMLPDSFYKLKRLYGLDDNGKRFVSSNLKSVTNHFNYHPENISKQKLIEKYINLSINGKFQTGNITIFQNSLHNLFSGNSKEFLEVLNEMNSKEKESFWTFFFDGLYIKELEDFSIYKKVNELNEEMIPVIKKVYLRNKNKSDKN